MLKTFGNGFRQFKIQRFVRSICSKGSYVRTEKRTKSIKPSSKHVIEFNEFVLYRKYFTNCINSVQELF